jgi:hypothetical protein
MENRVKTITNKTHKKHQPNPTNKMDHSLTPSQQHGLTTAPKRILSRPPTSDEDHNLAANEKVSKET